MGIFGWSLPPGCTTLPGEDYDDSICASCEKPLPDPLPVDNGWPDNGFCDQICAVNYHWIKLKSIALGSGKLHQQAVDEMEQALNELIETARNGGVPA